MTSNKESFSQKHTMCEVQYPLILDVIDPTRIEEIRRRIDGNTSAPIHTLFERNNDLLIVLKPFKCPENSWARLKDPLKFIKAEERIKRHINAVASAQMHGIKDLLLPQTFIICKARDGTSFVVKVTEYRKQVRPMAEISLRKILTNRLYVETMCRISIFGLIQLILYKRKYDLLEVQKFSEIPSLRKIFITTLKSLNVFSGINPQTDEAETFIDADWFTYVSESKLSTLKTLLNMILWLRNTVFYCSMLVIHLIGLSRVFKFNNSIETV